MVISKNLTAQEIIAMFRDELGLMVCDDEETIEQKKKDKYPRYKRDERSPDGVKRSRAQRWFKNVEALVNRRIELLEIVYEYFALWADTALLESIYAGHKIFNDKIEFRLRDMLSKDCRVEQELENRFLTRYCRERNIQFGNILPQAIAAPITHFQAQSGLGKIHLSWTQPKSNCDNIEIIKEAEAVEANDDLNQPQILYRGNDQLFIDQDVLPGIKYKYTIYSIYQSERSTGNIYQAICLAEIQNIKKSCENGQIHISWQCATANSKVIVERYLANDSNPNSTPKYIHPHNNSFIIDSEIVEGASYLYILKTDFDNNLITPGIEVQISVPKPPPAVNKVRTIYKFEQSKSTVSISWEAVQIDKLVQYTVIRREGDIPPANIGDGIVIQKAITRTRCLDEQVTAGCRYTYAVFTIQGYLKSRQGTASRPTDIMDEVTNLIVKTADQTIELQWQAHENVYDVIVTREQGFPPRNHNDGKKVTVVGKNFVKDDSLENGSKYCYRICCAYTFGETLRYTPGITADAIPEKLPITIKQLTTSTNGIEVECQWQPPDFGKVVIIRTNTIPNYQSGDIIACSQIPPLGEQIVTIGNNKAVDSSPDVKKPYYNIFTISGDYACYGNTQACAAIPDIENLQLFASKSGILLFWSWPLECSSVMIARRVDSWPQGLNDPQATYTRCSRTEYSTAGGRFIDRIENCQGCLHYIVYRQAANAPDEFFSSGLDANCRGTIESSYWRSLHYKIQPANKQSPLTLKWSIEDPAENFLGFILCASQTSIPSSPQDGIELLRWTEKTSKEKTSYQQEVDLTLIQKQQWPRFFCKVFVIDPMQKDSTLVIHPNYCAPFSADGKLLGKKTTDLKRRYHGKIPRFVICPECFTRFPLNKMLYASYAGGEPILGKYRWLDKLLGKEPKVPRDSAGRLLTRKICPNKHDLPFTAGSQESLIIGLVGAVNSGKSHYIASLIHRLETQVGADFQASLLPVTSDTHDRYQKEFYRPLFDNYSELEKTVGAPSPLIYDLTIDRSLWGEDRNRTITLAFYDTAGENLSDPKRVQQMARYLEVASGVIFLIDPLQSKQLREVVPSLRKDKRVEPHAIFTSVLELLKSREDAANNLFSIPVAVALTKCDVLQNAQLIPHNRLWCSDHRHIGFFDKMYHDDIAGLLEEAVRRWCPTAYQIVKAQFARHAFFGVSATGCKADNKGYYQYVSPWRVEDPLLWILAQLGVIDIKE